MITSDKQVPRPQAGISYERGKDPWHPDAFKGIDDVYEQFDDEDKQEPRKEGWFMVDWCGNFVGWIPDGTVMDD